MECPYCSRALRVVESVPPALLQTHIRVTCPLKSCGRDMVAIVRQTDGLELLPLTTETSRNAAWQHVAIAQPVDLVMTVMGTVASLALALLYALFAFLEGPSPEAFVAALALCGIGIALMLVIAGGFAIDLALGARAWLRNLPRPLLNLMPLPQTYR
jgi:hypothetical protein